ncbi:hypothetical protein M427DRAFT_204943 [Gonapodya prolifera JEL478]|uniref:Uncharacterized protein n=1 Tax=Gonapodya prolifera (strain JEL478) TaxID=1344416 RepID=A0A138ZZZ6_GONPJ|nr:hypothetical protein M427DRAFT_204943 [Gonapodya prolifera JEL478]|eukprot:KXS09855.1 hypothetical protein M427DRAFT_204943 [Gonapodya prolifera JEL478]
MTSDTHSVLSPPPPQVTRRPSPPAPIETPRFRRLQFETAMFVSGSRGRSGIGIVTGTGDENVPAGRGGASRRRCRSSSSTSSTSNRSTSSTGTSTTSRNATPVPVRVRSGTARQRKAPSHSLSPSGVRPHATATAPGASLFRSDHLDVVSLHRRHRQDARARNSSASGRTSGCV